MKEHYLRCYYYPGGSSETYVVSIIATLEPHFVNTSDILPEDAGQHTGLVRVILLAEEDGKAKVSLNDPSQKKPVEFSVSENDLIMRE